MAQQVEVWQAADGSYWSSESQALAYEMKLYLINLGKSAAAINVDTATGLIDENGINTLVTFAVSAMQITGPALTAAVSASAAKKMADG